MFAAATHTSAKETVRPRSSPAGKRVKENGARDVSNGSWPCENLSIAGENW
jgi:hypothetical protein